MGRALRFGLFCAIAMVLAVAPAAAGGSQLPAVRVLLHNSTTSPDSVLAEARAFSVGVFEAAGVDLQIDDDAPKVCPAAASGPFCVQVLIRPRNPISQPGLQRTMGVALAADANRAVLSVYLDAVTDVARRYGLPVGKVLGIALAHELGHVLLPPPSHSADGIMQAAWEGDDLRKAAASTLAFHDAQAGLIRERLSRRAVQ